MANACTDRTAGGARADGVRVIETPVPGKPHALRLGDEACRTFPRIYLDADVELDAAPRCGRWSRAWPSPASWPAPRCPMLDLTGVGRWPGGCTGCTNALVAPNRALAGVGVYVLTEAGHARVFPMPDVISDDGWVHASFTPDERVVVSEARVAVRPARTIRAYLNRRVRVRRGNRQLAALGRPAPRAALDLGDLRAVVRGRRRSARSTPAVTSPSWLLDRGADPAARAARRLGQRRQQPAAVAGRTDGARRSLPAAGGTVRGHRSSPPAAATSQPAATRPRRLASSGLAGVLPGQRAG